jgi:hypothetical protein
MLKEIEMEIRRRRWNEVRDQSSSSPVAEIEQDLFPYPFFSTFFHRVFENKKEKKQELEKECPLF